MNKREILEQIEAARGTGASDEQIAQALNNGGLSPEDISMAMGSPGQWLYQRIYFKQLSWGRKTLLIIMMIFFLILVVGNVYLFATGKSDLFGSQELVSRVMP